MAVLKAASEVEFAVGSGRRFHSRMVSLYGGTMVYRYGRGVDKQEPFSPAFQSSSLQPN